MSCHWLTPQEAADKIRVTKSTIYRWIRADKLSCHLTPGGRVRICQKVLELTERRPVHG